MQAMPSIRRSVDHLRGSQLTKGSDTVSRFELREELQIFLLKSLSPEIERAVEKALLSALALHLRQNGDHHAGARIEHAQARIERQTSSDRNFSGHGLQSASAAFSSVPNNTGLHSASAAFNKVKINAEDAQPSLGFHADTGGRAMPSFAVKLIDQKREADESVRPPKGKRAWGAVCLPEGSPERMQAPESRGASRGSSRPNSRASGRGTNGAPHSDEIRHGSLQSLNSMASYEIGDSGHLHDPETLNVPGSIEDRDDVKALRLAGSCDDSDGAAADIAAGHDRPGRKVMMSSVVTSHSIDLRPSEFHSDFDEDGDRDFDVAPAMSEIASVRCILNEAPEDFYVQNVERRTRMRIQKQMTAQMTGISHAEEKTAENAIYMTKTMRTTISDRNGLLGPSASFRHALDEPRRCPQVVAESCGRCWQYCWFSFRTLIKSEMFDYFMGVFLALNAISIGIQADYMARNLSEDHPPTHLRVIEVVFCVIFFLELTARIAVHRTKFLSGKNWKWHFFDSIVVFFSITDELTQLLLTGTKIQQVIMSLGVLRMLRLMRVVRLVRMVRLIPELKSMVYLISASMWSFFWTVVLLTLMMYCVAVYFTDIGTDVARDMDPKDLEEAKALGNDEPTILSCWGGVGNSILSLWLAISGGDDWRNFIDVFFGHSSYLINTAVFSLYIAFTTLVMLNLVTGVFVEGAQRIIREDKDSELLKLACRLFARTDKDGSYDITWEEFRDQLESKEMDDYFKAVDLSRGEAKDLFKLLDLDQSGSISIEEFVKGCLRLRGPARSVDLMALVYDFKLKNSQFQECLAVMDDNMLRLAEMLKKNVRATVRQHQSLRSQLSQPLLSGVVEEYLV